MTYNEMYGKPRNPRKTEPERVLSYENMTGFHRVERVRRKF
jgi:hypothetical protein